MRKALSLGALIVCATMVSFPSGLSAQDAKGAPDLPPDLASPPPPEPMAPLPNPGNLATSSHSLANTPFLSSTGQTVPHPGLLQSGGQAEPARRAHDKEDEWLRKGICTNC